MPPDSESLHNIPVRMLNEMVYCPRLFYYEHIQGEFASNSETVQGTYIHRRVDEPTGRDSIGNSGEHPPEQVLTAVGLDAPILGISTKVDRLEIRDGIAISVDYKKGTKPDVPEGAYEPERVQVCAQGLVLRENGYESPFGEIWFAESNERVRVEFTKELVSRVHNVIREARELATGDEIPPPLDDSPKCPRCSLVGICLPDETNALAGEDSQEPNSRRLVPPRPDAQPLYIQDQGSYLGKKADSIYIKQKGKVVQTIRMIDVTQITVYGNVQISTALLREMCFRSIPVCYLTYAGWIVGILRGEHKNVILRIAQFRAADDPEMSLSFARSVVSGKVLNSRTLLRRNLSAPNKELLLELKRLSDSTKRATNLATLLGIEGAAAKAYFQSFSGLISDQVGSFAFSQRNRRPPRDRVNALLSFAYSLLAKDLAIISATVGLDPFRGLYHQSRYGKPALALDLMEEFRPIVADSVVVQVINTGEIRLSDFVCRAGAVALTPRGRKAFIQAYERRMNSSIRHPLFGYKASYRRIAEIQTRLLARFLLGEIDNYPPFRTR